jgi:hypothetical protein
VIYLASTEFRESTGLCVPTGQHLVGSASAEERMDLADTALDGQGRGVGQPGLERGPDPLGRVVLGAVAGPVQHPQPGMGPQPALHDPRVVDDGVVADHRYHRGGGEGGQQVLAEGGEGGADGLAADLVAPAAGAYVHGAEDGAPMILAGVMTSTRCR